MQVLSFPFALESGAQSPLLTAMSSLQRTDPGYHFRVLEALLSRRLLSIWLSCKEGQGTFDNLAMSHLSAHAILWGKNHSHPHGRLRLREARVTQRPEPALLHSRAFCLKDAPQGQVTTGDPWAPGAAGRHWTSSPKRPQFMPCWLSWHTWGERLNRAEHDLASAITSCVISANSLNLSESVLSPAQWS